MSALTASTTVAEALNWMAETFIAAGITSPRVEAEWLLTDILSTDRPNLYFCQRQILSIAQRQRLQAAVQQRQKRMPLQQILGKTEFFSLPIGITPQVLIPRPETEILVEVLAARLRPHPGPIILDLGTGSGAVSVALAHTLPASRIVATDCSISALRVARKNASHNGVEGRIAFVQGDLLTPFCTRPTFQAVVSNPPYIPSHVLPGLQPEVRDFEPHIALDGGPDGLRFYPPIISQACARLRSGGWLALELGDGQASRVSSLVSASSSLKNVDIVRDLTGTKRVLLARKRN